MNIWEDKMWGIMIETIALMKKYINGRRQRKVASITPIWLLQSKAHSNFCPHHCCYNVFLFMYKIK